MGYSPGRRVYSRSWALLWDTLALTHLLTSGHPRRLGTPLPPWAKVIYKFAAIPGLALTPQFSLPMLGEGDRQRGLLSLRVDAVGNLLEK
jgi:hypothetical protein